MTLVKECTSWKKGRCAKAKHRCCFNPNMAIDVCVNNKAPAKKTPKKTSKTKAKKKKGKK